MTEPGIAPLYTIKVDDELFQSVLRHSDGRVFCPAEDWKVFDDAGSLPVTCPVNGRTHIYPDRKTRRRMYNVYLHRLHRAADPSYRG